MRLSKLLANSQRENFIHLSAWHKWNNRFPIIPYLQVHRPQLTMTPLLVPLLIKLVKWPSRLCICHRRPSFGSSEFTWPYAVDNQVEMERGKGPYIVINIFYPVWFLHKAGCGLLAETNRAAGHASWDVFISRYRFMPSNILERHCHYLISKSV